MPLRKRDTAAYQLGREFRFWLGLLQAVTVVAITLGWLAWNLFAGFFVLLSRIATWVTRARSEEGEARGHAIPRALVEASDSSKDGQVIAHVSLKDVAESMLFGDDFFADTSRSPDGRYLVGASPTHLAGSRQMRGVLALADTVESRRLFRILVENPHAPRVADDGLVIVQDWKRPGQLGSAVRCFDSTGRELWAKHFRRYGVASAEFAEDGTQVLVSRLDGTLLQLDARIGREIAGSESRAKVTQ